MTTSSLTPVLGTLHALQVPIPYPMKTVTVLIDAPRGRAGGGPVTLVDCALDTPEARAALEGGLGELGLHWPDIDRLIVTHHHPDHYGLAGVVEERSGARVEMLDVEIGRGERYWHMLREWFPGHVKHLRDHGLPQAGLEGMSSENPRVHPASRVHPLREGQNVELAGRDWEVLWLPGHADGHLGLWNEQDSLLIAGDAILPRISPNVGLYAYTRPDPLGDYLQTLGKLEALNPARAVVGHGTDPGGPVMEGVQARARELRAHHHERLDFMKAEADRTPRSAYDLSLAMFPRDLNVSGRRFALAETLAHLAHLRLLGQLYRTWNEEAQVWEYHGEGG